MMLDGPVSAKGAVGVAQTTMEWTPMVATVTRFPATAEAAAGVGFSAADATRM
jgi:hypothetical protein